MKHVTIKDVAKLAGVGIATASRALNNKGEISPETKKRVLQAAELLGYVPNSLARGLISGKTKKIGVIVTTILNPFYASVVAGIESVLASKGYTIALYNSNEDSDKEFQAILNLYGQRVDGIILAPVEYKSNNVKYLQKINIPFVLVARNTLDENIDFVICDDKTVGRIGTKYLIEKGHEKIFFLNSWKSSSARFRLEGYKEALKETGLSINSKLIYSLKPDENLEEVIPKILKENKNISAIFCFCDVIAIGVMKILKNMKIKIPDDIAILGCDNLDFTEILDPPLTTIEISRYEMGIKSAEILLKKIKKEEKENNRIVLEPKLISRLSA